MTSRPFRRTALLLALAPAVLLGACLETALEIESIGVEARVRPEPVAPGDSFQATIKFQSLVADPLRLRFSHDCAYFLSVSRGGEPVALDGADFACTAAVTEVTLPPGDSVVYSTDLVAAVDGVPAEEGEYVMRFDLTGVSNDMAVRFHVADTAATN